MISITTRFVAVVAGLFVLAAAPAQAGSGPDRVERELARTDELLVHAHEVVRNAIGPRPREVLGEAREIQTDARASFSDRRYQEALAKTRLARELAARAVELARAQIRLLERVRHLLAEDRELVARAREAAHHSGSREAARLVGAGVEQLERAQRAFHDHEFRQAVRFALSGRELLLRAIRLAEGDRFDVPALREEIARTEELLRAAREAGAVHGVDARRLDEAMRLLIRAKEALAAREAARAETFARRARELALDALRDAENGAGTDAARAHVARVTERLVALTARVNEADLEGGERERAGRALAEAREHVERARDAIGDGRGRKALAEAQIAAGILDRLESRLP